MSIPNTNPFTTLHHSLSQALPDYDSSSSTSPTLYSVTPTPSPQNPSTASTSAPPPPSQQTDKASSSQPPNKEPPPIPIPIPTPHPSSSHTANDIYTLLLKMGQAQDTMRASIAHLEAITTRGLRGTTPPTIHTEDDAAHAVDTGSTTSAVLDATALCPPAVKRAHVAAPSPPLETGVARGSLASETTTGLGDAHARLERENAALREEVEGLKRVNRRLRVEWRRNVMLQGLRWIGRDF
ncbi:hypothetical protein PMIN01_01633 [Paraphaeosphaeria minitans]|uniref:Uncharacterized protein n=1 Tax=Paraphaeosphaeria minitans TaxID=565426 RepID=A0A9P6KUN9_9PLEO|nr:hypothetical protein PMIN01_01633 [Paraphaeosphaeria minitans]